MSGEASVDLYWLPLGAGGHSVRLNGKVFEVVAARLAHRTHRTCTTRRSSLLFRMGALSLSKRQHRETERSAALSVRGQSVLALRRGCGYFATRSGVGGMASSRTLTRPSTVRCD